MNYENISDSELISRLKQDDRLAFEHIYRSNVSDLYKYISGRVDTSNNCDEILIDVFLSLWLDRHNLSHDLKSHLRILCRTRLAIYACDNPSSTLSQHLKALFYETFKEENAPQN